MISKPQISVITPNFNGGKYIEETIDSVLSQNYSNLQYIVIDGGSKDESVEIIQKYEKHLAYWISEPDFGQTDAINKGIIQAKGDICNWLNSDDYLEPNALKILAESYEPSIDIYCGITLDIDKNKKVMQRKGSRLLNNEFDCLSRLPTLLHQPGTYFRTEIFREFPMDYHLHFCMDLQVWLNYLLCHRNNLKIKNIDSVLANLRIHSDSKTGSDGSIDKFWSDIYALYAAITCNKTLKKKVLKLSKYPAPIIPDFETQKFQFDQDEICRIIHGFLYQWGCLMLKYNRRRSALEHFHLIQNKYMKELGIQNFRNLYLGTLLPFLTKLKLR